MEATVPSTTEPYDSFERAVEVHQQWAKENGYALSKLSTLREYKGGPYKQAYLICDRGREYRSTAQVRKASTKQVQCPFKLRVSQIQRTGTYQVVPMDLKHNHEPSWHSLAHAIHRRRDHHMQDTIRAEARAGVKPKQIMTRLIQENPTITIKRKDIYNEMLKIRARELQGKSPIEAVLRQLSDPELWVFDYKTDSHGRLSHLFFAYLKTVRIFESHPDVLMADCTYRTTDSRCPYSTLLVATLLVVILQLPSASCRAKLNLTICGL